MLNELIRRSASSIAFRLARQAEQAARRLRKLDLRQMGLRGDIRTWTSTRELAKLYELAAACPQGGNIVEIGSYLGASTSYLAAGGAQKGVHLTCLDTWQNETIPEGERDTFPEFERNIAGARKMITIIRKRSAELTLEELRLPIHLAFLDADHSYESTKADAAAVLPLMALEGIVAFHDVVTFPGVAKALGEILIQGEWCLDGHVDTMSWIRRANWSEWAKKADGKEAGA